MQLIQTTEARAYRAYAYLFDDWQVKVVSINSDWSPGMLEIQKPGIDLIFERLEFTDGKAVAYAKGNAGGGSYGSVREAQLEGLLSRYASEFGVIFQQKNMKLFLKSHFGALNPYLNPQKS